MGVVPIDNPPDHPYGIDMANRFFSSEEAIEFAKACLESGWETEGVYNALLDYGFSIGRTTTILLWVARTHWELMDANDNVSLYQKSR